MEFLVDKPSLHSEAAVNVVFGGRTDLEGGILCRLIVFRCSLFGTIAGCLLFPVAARADGLIYELPDDGTWVRYNVLLEILDAEGAAELNLKGTVTIRSVGRENDNGESCRWIEWKSVQEQGAGKPDRIELFKLLIPEKHLKAGEAPVDHVVRAWHKVGGVIVPSTGELLDFETETPKKDLPHRLRGGHPDLAYFLGGPLMNPRMLDEMEIDTPLGKLACVGVASQDSIGNVFKTELYRKWETRLNDKIPFGVAEMKLRIEIKRNGKSAAGGNQRTLTLAEVGKDAKSEIPDAR
ncbi:MAG: hypothetical protein EXS05_14715 [Planctomycetaceae bacterium]|nr:hypothetical protein [Planctomycetaceae bacterium]